MATNGLVVGQDLQPLSLGQVLGTAFPAFPALPPLRGTLIKCQIRFSFMKTFQPRLYEPPRAGAANCQDLSPYVIFAIQKALFLSAFGKLTICQFSSPRGFKNGMIIEPLSRKDGAGRLSFSTQEQVPSYCSPGPFHRPVRRCFR